MDIFVILARYGGLLILFVSVLMWAVCALCHLEDLRQAREVRRRRLKNEFRDVSVVLWLTMAVGMALFAVSFAA